MPLSLNEDVALYRKYLNHIEVTHVLTKALFIGCCPPLLFYGRRALSKTLYDFTRQHGQKYHRLYETSAWTIGFTSGSYYCINKLKEEKTKFYTLRNLDVISPSREEEINSEILAEHDNAEIVYKRYTHAASNDVYDYLCSLEYAEQRTAHLSTTLTTFGHCSMISLFFAHSTLKFFGKKSRITQFLTKNSRRSFAIRFIFCWLLPFYALRSWKQDLYWKKWYHIHDKVPPTDAEVEILEGSDITVLSQYDGKLGVVGKQDFGNKSVTTSIKDVLSQGKTTHIQFVTPDVNDGQILESKTEIVPEENQYITWKELVDKRNSS